METTARTFAVILSKKDHLESELLALVKRANRKGIPCALSWSWGKAYTDEVHVLRSDLTLTGETPHFSGWSFVATLQHLDVENVVRVLPGQTLSAEYRTRGAMCDHCNQIRRRVDTYVLSHEDGRTVQVGSSCLKDFLGSDKAGDLAAMSEILALAGAAAEESCSGGGFGSGDYHTLAGFLAFVAWSVRVGGWKSRTVARESGGQATADLAWELLTDDKARRIAGCKAGATVEDAALAVAAAAWAEALTDEAVNGASSDYLHNLRAVCRTGVATSRTSGIAASVIVAYQRHLGVERAKAEKAARPLADIHVGSVGQKVSFGLPAKKGKAAPVSLSDAPLILDFVTGYETDYGYTTVLKFRTSEGACLVWKASNTEISRSDVGKAYAVKGTIKAHDEYRGAKQTILTRCNCVEVSQ